MKRIQITAEMMAEAVKRQERDITMEVNSDTIVLSYSAEVLVDPHDRKSGFMVKELWRHEISVPQEVEPYWVEFSSWKENDRIHYRRCLRNTGMAVNLKEHNSIYDLLCQKTIKTSGGSGWENFLSALTNIIFEVSGIKRKMTVDIPWKDRDISKSSLSWRAHDILCWERVWDGFLTPGYEMYLRRKGIESASVLEAEINLLLQGIVSGRSYGSPHQVNMQQLMNLRATFGSGYKTVLWHIRQIGLVAHRNQDDYPREYWNSCQAGMDMVATWAIENRSRFWALAVRGKNWLQVIRQAAPDVYAVIV